MKSAERVELMIGRFQRPCVDGFVESQQIVASKNFDTSRLNVGPGAEQRFTIRKIAKRPASLLQ